MRPADATPFEKPRRARAMRSWLVAGLAGLSFASSAFACEGVFLRDSQNYDNRSPDGHLETVEGFVPKGTRDDIIGTAMVEGKTYYIQLRAYLHKPSDIRLSPGCKLKPYG